MLGEGGGEMRGGEERGVLYIKVEDRPHGRMPVIEGEELFIEAIDARADRILAGQG